MKKNFWTQLSRPLYEEAPDMSTSLNPAMIPTEPLTPGTCEWCGDKCDPAGSCCSLSCEAQMHREEARQGRIVMRALKKWRKFGGRKGTPGEGAWTEIGQLTSQYLRSDRQRRERMNHERRAKAAEAEQKKEGEG
jgi:hypothetical protein